jgi:hypothetical protein
LGERVLTVQQALAPVDRLGIDTSPFIYFIENHPTYAPIMQYLIDYIEIEIGGQTIDKQWGEWMNILNELNVNNFDGTLDEYIGNTPDLTEYKYVQNGIKSSTLYVPLTFWFCKNSGLALPLLCLEYNTIRLNIQINNFNKCAIFSPSNYIEISQYYGNGIIEEPLLQISNQGIAWGEFDSLDVATVNNQSLSPITYYLYYRKISDNPFLTTTIDYFNNLLATNNIVSLFKTNKNYVIYGLYSGSVYIPIASSNDNINSIYIEKTYYYDKTIELPIKNMYVLSDYIYIDKEERVKFFKNKHDYVIEQIYYNNLNLNNKYNKNLLEIINPCKYIVFMGQVSYFTNANVNYSFNYKTLFFNNCTNLFKVKSVINTTSLSLNLNQINEQFNMNFYTYFIPFTNFPQARLTQGFGITSFCLYPNNIQPSGTCNMSCFNSFSINTTFNTIDNNYTNYIFKTYAVTYNYLRISNGICATIFNSNF